MVSSGGKVELRGSEMALLVAALGLLSDWPFEVADARSMVSEGAKRAAEALGDRLFSDWRAYLERFGLWNEPSGRWTQELLEQRAKLRLDVQMSGDEATLAELALRATFTEFHQNWGEFCVVATGALNLYPVGPDDLDRLADRFAQEEEDQVPEDQVVKT
jgi:hypothetical protein